MTLKPCRVPPLVRNHIAAHSEGERWPCFGIADICVNYNRWQSYVHGADASVVSPRALPFLSTSQSTTTICYAIGDENRSCSGEDRSNGGIYYSCICRASAVRLVLISIFW
jgi:hypothetical protein